MVGQREEMKLELSGVRLWQCEEEGKGDDGLRLTSPPQRPLSVALEDGTLSFKVEDDRSLD